MHSIKELRKNLDFFKKKFKDRNLEFDLDEFVKLDNLNRERITLNKLTAKRKVKYLENPHYP